MCAICSPPTSCPNSTYREEHQSDSAIAEMFSARPLLYTASFINMLANSWNCKKGNFFFFQNQTDGRIHLCPPVCTFI